MPWTFVRAKQFTTGLHKGVLVVINNLDDEDAPQTQNLFFGFPFFIGQTQAAFKAAIRGEVRALLDHLNTEDAGTDATPDYEDL